MDAYSSEKKSCIQGSTHSVNSLYKHQVEVKLIGSGIKSHQWLLGIS